MRIALSPPRGCLPTRSLSSQRHREGMGTKRARTAEPRASINAPHCRSHTVGCTIQVPGTLEHVIDCTLCTVRLLSN